MAVVTMRQLLESGVHFGHQTRRWNPKMKRFIFTERNGIYIIDLRQTLDYIDRSYDYVRTTVAEGGSILFVGTKKQAQEAIAEQASRVGMPYVNHRWLGGMLTNFSTVFKRLQRMKELEAIELSGAAQGYTKKETLQLQREKLKLTNANDHVILPEIISKEPLGPLVRHGDDQWFDVVKWTHNVMLNAEELGVSSKNVDDAMKSNQPEIRRLLGVEGNFGEQLGLTKDWVVRIVKQVGNYGEVFERNVGTGSRLGRERRAKSGAGGPQKFSPTTLMGRPVMARAACIPDITAASTHAALMPVRLPSRARFAAWQWRQAPGCCFSVTRRVCS